MGSLERVSSRRAADQGDDFGGISAPGAAVDRPTRQLPLNLEQRVTSIYGVIRTTPPPMLKDDESAFTSLHFDLETETFKFYANRDFSSSVARSWACNV